MDRNLAILGGMGPKASLLFHTLLLEEMSDALEIEGDQDFLNIVHFSFSENIVDRTAFLLGEAAVNPAHEIFEQLTYLEQIAKARNIKFVVGVPCNTFHAKKVFTKFKELKKKNLLTHLEILNIIDETTGVISQVLPKNSKIGILSTSAEWKMQIYNDYLKKYQISEVERDESLQKQIQECIYNKKWGLKTASTDYKKSVDEVKKIITHFKTAGAKAIIFGCTEFSLISDEISDPDLKFFDSSKILAREMVAKALENE